MTIEKVHKSRYVFGEDVSESYPNIDVSIERITPAVARRMLESNVHNRDIKRFESVSKALTSGEWALNGATIVFSDDGILLDGQHRLHACVKTGVPFDTIVVRGVGMREQMTMDVGTRRKIGDFLKMDGYKDANAIASIGNALFRADYLGIDAVFSRAFGEHGTVMATVDFIEGCYDERIAPIMTNIRAVSRTYRGVHKSTLGVLFDQFRKAGDDELDAFVRQVVGRDPRCRAVELLSTRLHDNAMKTTGKLPQKVIAALIIKAWNAYMTGEHPQNLSFRRGGASPEAFPTIYLG